MELRILKRSGSEFIGSLSLHSENASVVDLKLAIQRKQPHLDRYRQKLTFGPNQILLEDDRSLKSYGIRKNDAIVLKDLGPQMNWRTVFFIEYLGPILMHVIVFAIYRLFSSKVNKGAFSIQKMAYYMVIGHYMKREMESAFVHRFSNATMPLFNLVKNCSHYWLLGGLAMAVELYRPSYRVPIYSSRILKTVCLYVFIFAELSNLVSHLQLRNLRPPGSKERRIPRGYAFEYVSCPNYFFESMAWLCVAILVNTYTSWIFWIVSTVQMYLWARKKHLAYHRQFKDYPKHRKAMFPLLL